MSMAVYNQSTDTAEPSPTVSGAIVLVAQDKDLVGELRAALRARMPEAGEILIPGYESARAIRERTEQHGGEIAGFIVGMSDPGQGVHLIRDLAGAFPAHPVAAVAASGSAEIILQAMRAGATEFLSPPFEIDQLVKSFAAAKAHVEPQAEPGQLYCVLPVQGGNGASTLALHVANNVARLTKKRTLLIDFDFHSGTIAFRIRIKPEFSIADALARVGEMDEFWDKISTSWKGIDILSAPEQRMELMKVNMRAAPDLMSSALRNYANVFVDMPAALFSSSRDMLVYADAICLVCTPEVMSLHLARRRLNELIEAGIRPEAIRLVVNRVGSTKALDTNDVESVVGKKVFQAIRNDYESLAEAHLKGGLVSPDSKLGAQFTDFACALAGVEPDQKKAKSAGKSRLRSLLSMGQ